MAKGLGLLFSVDMRDGLYLMREELERYEGPLPDRKKWEHGKILDQGREGACVGFGWQAWENSKPVGFAEQQGNRAAFRWYHRAQELDEFPGTDYKGTTVRAGAKVAQERRLLREYVWASSIQEISAWVRGIGPVVMGSKWLHSMDHVDEAGFVHIDPSSGVRGGHCYLLFGVGRRGNYWFQQSWGEDYGKEGCFRLRPEEFARLVSMSGTVACTSAQTRPA